MKNKYKILIPTFISILLFLFIYIYYGFAPFGNKTLAINDANIQYLDLYMYYKNVFLGEDSFLYSFSNGLGGNMMAIVSYYLTSPFVLLSLLFNNDSLYSYFNICVLLKLSLATFTISYYLNKRFDLDLNRFKDLTILIGLSLGYSLSQYSIVQSSNIMWLDGVYMLPVVLLNIYNLINNKKNSFLCLSISVGLTILFNWYIGLINCIFTFIYFLIEIILKKIDSKDFSIKGSIIKYIISMILGGLLGSVILLPTMYALSLSSRGSFSLSTSLDYVGDIKSYVTSYVYGGESTQFYVCIFSGLYTFIGFISCLFSRNINKYERILFICILGFILLMFYWTPLLCIFSLFKDVTSYYYRYSYLASFLLVFVSSCYFKEDNETYLPIISAIIFILILIILYLINNLQINKNVILTIIITILISITLVSQRKYTIFNYLLILLIIFDTGFSTKTLINLNDVDDYDEYKKFVNNEETLINEIKSLDNSIYRINSTYYRNQNNVEDLASNYNEALAYNYYSIASYTSSPNDSVRNLLDSLGYRKSGENISVTSTGILASDSLLGVKYIISPYSINGLNKVSNLSLNNKYIYENPYSLGIAFTYKDIDLNIEANNQFEYINGIYSVLLGEDVKLYKELEYEVFSEADEYAKTPKVYEIETPSYVDYAIYGYIPNNGYVSGYLNINNKYTLEYGKWLSPSLFYIPCDSELTYLELYLDGSYSNLSDAQFYALDLNLLESVTDSLKKNNVEMSISNNKVKIYVETDDENNNLFLSIPYDKGWSIKVNGKEAKYELIGDCLYSFALTNGSNDITMTYYPPYLNLGICLSLIALTLVIFINNKLSKW